MTLKDLRSAIFSPGSAPGLTPCGAPDGLTVAPSGQVPAPANHSASQEKAGDSTTPRHLWPTWRQLIKECAPYVIFGEQVASKDGLTWFDAVQLDLEEAEYAVAVIDLCAAGFGAPHIRQRLFWVADATYKQHQKCLPECRESHRPHSGRSPAESTGYCLSHGLAHPDNDSRERRLSGWQDSQREVVNGSSGCNSAACGTNAVNGVWRDADWLFCRDGKWRPVKPGIKPLVNGTPGRVGQLRAYGNAIVAPVAETFIRAYMEAVTP